MSEIIRVNKRANRLANLFIFLCVFVTDAMSLPLAQGVKITLLTIVCAIVVIEDLAGRNFSLRKNEITWVIFPSLLLLLTQITSSDFVLSYESKILMMYAGFVMYRNVPFRLFRDKYIRIMYVICIVSLIGWFCGFLGIPIWNLLPSSGEGQYRTIFFHAFDTFSGVISERNNGPFWEPGVFQIYINIAFMFLLFSNEQRKMKLYLLVFIVALLTTTSTTGYISFALILLAYIYEKGNVIKPYQLILILVFLLGAFFYISWNEELYLRLFGKFQEGSSNSASFIIRSNEVAFYYEAWTANLWSLFCGSGSTYAYEYATKLHSIADVMFEGSTLTTMRELASFGLIFSLTRLVLMFKFFKSICKKAICACLLFGVIILCINTESMVFSMFFSSFFYYGLDRNIKERRIS